MKRTNSAPESQSLFGFDNGEQTCEVPATALVPVTVPETNYLPSPEPLSVTALTQQLKYVLEPQFQNILVVGEVSRPSPSNGHLYFALKDDDAVLNTCIWRSKLQRAKFDIRDGLEVICRGKIEIYDKRGSYSLIVESIEPKGIGSLELAFRQLYERLSADGLFDERRKRPLPMFPRNVVLITAEHKAAANDFIRVLGNRTQRVDVLLAPTKVQGEGAAAGIANIIKCVNAIAETGAIRADVIVITRGGGSKEDLWTFNEEVVVRAVVTSAIPVISAIGHEIDVSLCDLAADLRAFT
ncbi:MAG: exodeoxyribonuclease VII large subunit, partial [Planctomycetaceae bacterium]|nr:exodeoxyribonuclease VII large subunit [Planctomycetaceae bacterium]